jgi:hypothetical protein
MTASASTMSNGRLSEMRSWFDIEKDPHFKMGTADFGKPFRGDYDGWTRWQQSHYELGRQFKACRFEATTTALQWRAMHDLVTP